MKFNKWTLGLAAVGVVSLTSAAYADESKVSQVNTALSNTTLSGYVDVSAQFNPNGGGGGTPNYYYYGSNPNSINLNVADIALDKPEDATPWASGYHAELWIGPDAAALGTTSFKTSSASSGTNSVSSTTSASSQVGIRQAYVMLNTPLGNGIDWKIGVFDTIIGYESTTSGNNPNYSHSFGYNLEPTTHTGILASYKATDWFQAQFGVADTSYAGGGVYTAGLNNGMYHPTFMWGPTLTAPDSFGWAKGATLSAGTIITGGNTAQGTTGAFNNGNGNGAKNVYVGFTLPTPVTALKAGGAFDYLQANDIGAHTWDLAGYATYAFNEKLSLNLRAEYMNAGGNTAAPIVGGGTTPVSLNGGAFQDPSGANAQAQEITATIQYAMWANVLTRLEIRWDHVNIHDAGGSPSAFYLSNTGNSQQNAFMIAAQAIYTF